MINFTLETTLGLMNGSSLLRIHLVATWAGVLAGLLSGTIMGAFFHQPGWLGGYASYPRRLLRLGHISYFGLAFVNALFALTVATYEVHPNKLVSPCLLTGAATMPLCCFVAAWRQGSRFLFSLPVVSLVLGAALLFVGLLAS